MIDSERFEPHDATEMAADDVGLGPVINWVLSPLASLKLTVALFAAAIFIILAGTLVQVEKDIWQVIEEYFRTWVAWIEFQIFLPPSFWGALFGTAPPKIPGGFPFPGGWLIGALMALNLLAAHLIRFKVQASGWRLVTGLLVTLLGIVLTTLVVLSANNPEGLQTEPWVSYDALWGFLLAMLGGSCLMSAYGWWRLPADQVKTKWLLGAGLLLQAMVLGYFVPRGFEGRLSDAGMRILWQLTQGGLASVVLLIGCIMVFKHRGGIVLLHGGIGLMMFGELLVGYSAVEGQMQIEEGQTVNFVQDIRSVELAVVDTRDPDVDRVTVIPKERLLQASASGTSITDPKLPFSVKIEQFLPNSEMRRVKPDEDNLANRGTGKEWKAVPLRPGSGTDTDSKVDLSSAYITLTDPKGQTLGSWLVGIIFTSMDTVEKVEVDGVTYDVSLRFKRDYKPYKFQLIDVRKDDYLGTNTPRNYSSDVRIVDPTRNVDHEVKIWMNNPLRFAGETFYQSGYHMDPQTKREATTLQVVTNTGWMIPYVSCMLVAVGLLAHFSLTLLRFLRRAESERQRALRSTEESHGFGSGIGQVLGIWVPILLTLFCAFYVAQSARTPKVGSKEFDFYAFGQLPVVSEGRAKPIDTLARTSLLAISGRQTYVDANGKSQPAVRWLLDVLARPDQAFTHRVFRIENFDVQNLVGVKPRERFRYSPEEFLPSLRKLTEQAEKAHQTDKAAITVYQKKVLELERKIGVLDLLMQAFNPPNIKLETFRDDLMNAMARQEALMRRQPPLAIPPSEADRDWETFSTAWTRNMVQTTFLNQQADEPTEAFSRILLAYADKDAESFNAEVAKYKQWLEEHAPPELATRRTNFESFFNRFQPFTLTQVLYLIAFVFGALAWLGWSQPLNRTAMGIALLAFALHTFALIARIYISGRPPVTNLYSSAVFIGWGCAALGLVLNMFFRNGVGTVIAAISGFLTLGVADFLSADGDTFSVLQAVLDTQFWLATHVTCITFGYSTTYLAGLLGMMYILRGVCTPSLTPEAGRDLYRMIYGSLCFSIFFSFVGTVLGGLWADDSWGRFWGWDPKENGALIIVLWNALALHARWGGMVKERGLAQLAVAGNIAVTWSWFGVNELGIGLHAYGFREGMVQLVAAICGVCLVVMAIGLVPRQLWWSTSANRSRT